MKKIFYLSIGTLVLLSIYVGGFFDPAFIKIDNIKITRPIFYKLASEKKNNVSLDEGDSSVVSFLNMYSKKSIHYFIQKAAKINTFDMQLHHFTNDSNSSRSNCNLIYENVNKKSTGEEYFQRIVVFRFPYKVFFHEMNKKRELEAIDQICNGYPQVSYSSET